MGAEFDAKWNTDLQGEEMFGGKLNATLRDYGRLRALLVSDGKRGDTQIWPKAYLLGATDWHKQTAVACSASVSTPTLGEESYSLWLGIEQHHQKASSP